MKVKLITTSTDLRHPGFRQLKRSLEHFGWDYDVLSEKYVAYGSKMINAYNYAKNTDCTHLFIVDAYDIFLLGTMDQALARITDKNCVLFNAERGCWPYGDWAKEYPEVLGPWKYLNGGAAFVEVEKFIKLFEENPIKHTDNDQVNLARIYLDKRNQYNMKLDNACELFQSIAFEDEKDFSVAPGIVFNQITRTNPIIIHGNGRTDMTKIYNLL